MNIDYLQKIADKYVLLDDLSRCLNADIKELGNEVISTYKIFNRNNIKTMLKSIAPEIKQYYGMYILFPCILTETKKGYIILADVRGNRVLINKDYFRNLKDDGWVFNGCNILNDDKSEILEEKYIKESSIE